MPRVRDALLTCWRGKGLLRRPSLGLVLQSRGVEHVDAQREGFDGRPAERSADALTPIEAPVAYDPDRRDARGRGAVSLGGVGERELLGRAGARGEATKMARPLEVMVSSRNATRLVDGRTLSDLRQNIRQAVQAVLAGPADTSRLKVWINEDSEAAEGSSDWYDESMRRAREAAIVLVLFSGDAGSIVKGRGIGICHAELETALQDARTKVRAIDVRKLVRRGRSRPTRPATRSCGPSTV